MSRKFRIGVDARPLTAPMSGVARVISNVLLHFPERERFEFVLYASRPCHADFLEIVNLPNVTWVQGDGWTAKRAGLWYNFKLPVLLRRDPVDLFWGSQQVIPPGLSRDVPVVLTCYDLVASFYPDTMRPLARMQQRAVMRLSMRRAESILAISTQTRDDTVQEYEYPIEQAGVALLGYEMPEVPVGEEREQLRGEVALRLSFRPSENFILAVSTIEPRKNYGVLLDAYMQYYRRVGLRAFPLVIAGRRGWETPEFYRRLEDAQRECGRIYTLEGLSDRHLNELYRTCGLFVMPSLYEGFGLPLLEALCNGRRALASDIPCFHEIGGAFARYLPAEDVEAWAAALEEYTIDAPPAAAKKKARGASVPPTFPVHEWTWERTAAIYHREFLKFLQPPVVNESPAASVAAGPQTETLAEDPAPAADAVAVGENPTAVSAAPEAAVNSTERQDRSAVHAGTQLEIPLEAKSGPDVAGKSAKMAAPESASTSPNSRASRAKSASRSRTGKANAGKKAPAATKPAAKKKAVKSGSRKTTSKANSKKAATKPASNKKKKASSKK